MERIRAGCAHVCQAKWEHPGDVRRTRAHNNIRAQMHMHWVRQAGHAHQRGEASMKYSGGLWVVLRAHKCIG